MIEKIDSHVLVFVYFILAGMVMLIPLMILFSIEKKRLGKRMGILFDSKEGRGCTYLNTITIYDPELALIWYIIKDNDSKKIYAVKDFSVADRHSRSLRKKIKNGDTGMFWIEEELDDKIDLDRKYESKDPSFDCSLLNDAIYVKGVIIFDKEKGK